MSKNIYQDDIVNLNTKEGVCGKTLMLSNPSFIKNIYNDTKDYIYKKWAKKHDFVSMICLPLSDISGKYNLGTISIYTNFEYDFNEHDIKFLQNCASHVSKLIQIIREHKELSVINKISNCINREIDLDTTLNNVFNEICRYSGFDNCFIVEIIENIVYVKHTNKLDLINSKIKIKKETYENIINFSNKKSGIVVVDKISKTSNLTYLVDKMSNIDSILMIPIKINDKTNEHFFILGNKKKNLTETSKIFSDPLSIFKLQYLMHRNLYNIFANQIEAVFEKNILIEKLKNEKNRNALTGSIISKISSDDDLEESLKSILPDVVDSVNGDIGFISIFSKRSPYILPNHYYAKNDEVLNIGPNLNNDHNYKGTTISDLIPPTPISDNGLIDSIIDNKHALLWQSRINEFEPIKFNLPNDIVKSQIISPLLYGNKVIGLIVVCSTKTNFNQADMEFLQRVGKQLAIIIKDKEFYKAAFALGETHFSTMEKSHICNVVAKKAAEIMRVPVTKVRLFEEKNDNEYLVVASGFSNNRLYSQNELHLFGPDLLKKSNCISWQCFNKAQEALKLENSEVILHLPFGKDNLENKDRTNKYSNSEFLKKFDLQSMVSVPLIAGSEVLGVINAYAKRKYEFFDKELHLLKNLAKSGAIALKNIMITRTLEEVNEKILDSAQLANPGHVAISFIHDARHTMHNINAYLTSLVHLLPDSIKKSKEGEGTIESLTHETDYINDLLSSLIGYAKTRKIAYKKENINDILAYVNYLYENRLKKEKITLTNERASKKSQKPILVDCDRTQIEQVFVNLLNNAIYALKRKTHIKKEIKLTLSEVGKDQNQILIVIRDNGAGISKNDLHKVFDPLFTSKGVEGSGFGLAICKRIIEENHKGEIRIYSDGANYTSCSIKLFKNL